METVRAEPEGNKQSLTREAENKGPGQRGVCVVSRRTVRAPPASGPVYRCGARSCLVGPGGSWIVRLSL